MPELVQYISHSPGETFDIGVRFGEKARSGEIYALDGDLGAGKTVFVKGFARGLGINEQVTSPTFTIMQVYDGGRLPLYHFDVYRIEEPEELYETGFEEFFYGRGVTVIEWASRICGLLPQDIMRFDFKRKYEINGDELRVITFSHSCLQAGNGVS